MGDLSQYNVGVRARSSVSVRQEDSPIVLDATAEGRALKLRIWTRRSQFQGALVHRELVISGEAEGESLDSVRATVARVAGQLWPMLALACNAAIGVPVSFTGFESTPGLTAREAVHEFDFRLATVEEEPPVPSRYIRVEPTLALLQAWLTSAEGPRIYRAAQQYWLALGHWYEYDPLVALSHVFMAAEALAPAMLRREMHLTGKTSAELADAWNVARREDGSFRSGDLQAAARRELIFPGDPQCHQDAREASDIFEHGYEDYGRALDLAGKVRDSAAAYVRSAIIRCTDCVSTAQEILLSPPLDAPLDLAGLTRRLTGIYRGELAAGEFPYFEWQPEYASTAGSERARFTVTDKVGAKFPIGVSFEATNLTVSGPRHLMANFAPAPELSVPDGTAEQPADPDSG